jgi:hypothetical protein
MGQGEPLIVAFSGTIFKAKESAAKCEDLPVVGRLCWYIESTRRMTSMVGPLLPDGLD